jgi:probable F420-dependent oxidoreductase
MSEDTTRIGVRLPLGRPGSPHDRLLHLARRAEDEGFDSVWFSDHVIVPREIRSPYPFSPDGRFARSPEHPWYDAVVAMSMAAAVTHRIEVGVAVLVLPIRDPVVLGKQIATLDAVAGGRIVLGVGAGWLAEEFDILGQDFPSRGARLDEGIDVLREVWSGRPAPYAGRHYRLPPDTFTHPTPARRVPIVIGGMSPAALRRAGRRGDGWLAIARGPVDVTALHDDVDEIARHRREAGRLDSPWRCVLRIGGPRAEYARLVPQLVAAGVTDLVVDVDWDDPADARLALKELRGELS